MPGRIGAVTELYLQQSFRRPCHMKAGITWRVTRETAHAGLYQTCANMRFQHIS